MDTIKSKTYEVSFVESLEDIFTLIFNSFSKSTFGLFLDSNISKLYGKKINDIIEANKKQVSTFIFEGGEMHKTRIQKEKAENFLFNNKFSRQDVLIAIGGGVIGDFTGYVASTFLRGIKFIQVPTTVLAMVDSSVGSKTGVNTPYGKNLIGSFYDPARIIIFTGFLKTLDKRNIYNGMAEIIKKAALFDAKYFELVKNSDIIKLIDENSALLRKIISRSIELKLEVVNQDKKEAGLRELLNFGHTIGHAIEFTLKGELLHGECVAIGMLLEVDIAIQLNKTLPIVREELEECIKNHKLPTDMPKDIDIKTVMKYMENDKKKKNNDIYIAVLENLGKANTSTVAVSRQIIKRSLASNYKVKPATFSRNLDEQLEIVLPGSKSITNRALLLAALGEGTIKLKGILDADDTVVMKRALKALDACEILEHKNDMLTMKGHGGKLKSPTEAIYVENSGTSARFLSSVLLMLNGSAVMEGNNRMKERPMEDLLEALKGQPGVKIDYLEREKYIPFKVTASGFEGGEIKIKSKVSSQYISSILMAAPYAKNPVKIVLSDIKEDDKLVSEPYIWMTINMMEIFGIKVKRSAFNVFEVPQGLYKNPAEFQIEPDASTASYDLAHFVLNGGKGKIMNIGSKSIQGDAKFSNVLQQMGVKVKINENDIQIEGGNLESLKPIDVMLGDQTDTFMTLAVILSQIEGRSCIRGIANQRVKECDRIKATRKNLVKCGVNCKELPDGLIIEGKKLLTDKNELMRKILIKTYNDHRIAMSFAILGSYFANNGHNIELTIQNKNCVNKTFPEFWEHISSKFGIKTSGTTEIKHNLKNNIEDYPLFVIGMRYSGKTTCSQILSKVLSAKVVEMDSYLVDKFQHSDKSLNNIDQIVAKKGWQGWRDAECDFIEEVFSDTQKYGRTVISTGGGIVERQSNVHFLSSFENVLFIDRPFDEIKKQYEADGNTQGMRPSYDSFFEDVYKNRLPKYNRCSSNIFCYPSFEEVSKKADINQIEYWLRVQKMLKKYVKKLYLQDDYEFIHDNSFFLAIDMQNLENLNQIQAIQINNKYQALELRLDFVISKLQDEKNAFDIYQELKKRIAFIKFFIEIPIILTFRSIEEGGAFRLSKTQDYVLLHKLYKYFQKTNLPDIFDIEFSPKNLKLLKNLKKDNQKIILSKHYTKYTSEEVLLHDIEMMNDQDEADILKVILNEKHDLAIFNNLIINKPLIKFKLGNTGKSSRVDCLFLCPVYDEMFGKALAPGQMTRDEILNTRLALGSPFYQKFYLFGTNVSNSASSSIHNTGFKHHNLVNYFYERKQIQSLEDALDIIKSPEFKGASITMPFKKEILPYLHEVHGVANRLGVVNTVIKFEGKLHGYNTDWFGILTPIREKIKHSGLKGKYCLILGAGGTCETTLFVNEILGLQSIVFNRSPDRIKSLKERYQSILVCEDYNNLKISKEDGDFNIDPIELAMIVSVVPEKNEFKFEDSLFKNDPLVFDVTYKAKSTNILEAAQRNKCSKIIMGIEMLIYQGYMQNNLFCGKKPPKREIRKAVMQYYEKLVS